MQVSAISISDFSGLFLKYRDKYIAIANSYLHNLPVAEDIVADAFTKFWAQKDRLHVTSSPESYIMAIVRNSCLNYLRNDAIHNKAKRIMLADIEALESDDMKWLFEKDVEQIFRSFMDSLPDDRRNIFYSSRFDNLTYNEIAEKYGISPRKVKREISKTIEAIKSELKDYLPALIIIFPGILS